MFDLGKVLVDFDYNIAGRRIASLSNLSAREVQEVIDHSPLLFRFETGRISAPQFFEEVQTATGFRGSFDEFCGFFADIFSLIEPMLSLYTELRAASVPTHMFSNTNALAVGHIRQRFPFFTHFNSHILSYKHSSMKPDARLYEVVEKYSGLVGPEILYLDDRPENVAAGVARGWKAVLHESAEKSRGAVESSGLLPRP